jgi:hypothetical protein
MRQRRKVELLETSASKELFEGIRLAAKQDSDAKTMLKDIHLVNAALATDRFVVSMDQKSRTLFDAATEVVTELKRVSWVNPEREQDDPISWLKNGAKDEANRRLGSQVL